MASWDESRHKRFKGRFAAMGLNKQTLRDKHNVHVDDGGNVTHKAPGGLHEHLGKVYMRQDRKGHGASVNIEGGGEINERDVSQHPFASQTEAAAAVAMKHPFVKTLTEKDLGGDAHELDPDKPEKGVFKAAKAKALEKHLKPDPDPPREMLQRDVGDRSLLDKSDGALQALAMGNSDPRIKAKAIAELKRRGKWNQA